MVTVTPEEYIKNKIDLKKEKALKVVGKIKDSMHFDFYQFQGEFLDVSELETKYCKWFWDFFSHCPNLRTIIGLENLDVSRAAWMTNMFSFSPNLRELQGLGAWNIPQCITMEMFRGCENLISIPGIENWDFLEALYYCYGAFKDCPYDITKINIVRQCKALQEKLRNEYNPATLDNLNKRLLNFYERGINE